MTPDQLHACLTILCLAAATVLAIALQEWAKGRRIKRERREIAEARQARQARGYEKARD